MIVQCHLSCEGLSHHETTMRLHDQEQRREWHWRFPAQKQVLSDMCWLLQVLEMLIAEDDTVPEVWYLLGLALHAGGEFDDALTAAGEAERLVSQRRHDDPDAGETLLDIEDLKV